MTTSTVLRRRLPVDVVGRGEPGMALVVNERNAMGWVRLTPWFADEPWRTAALGPGRAMSRPRRRGTATAASERLTGRAPGEGGGRAGPELGL